MSEVTEDLQDSNIEAKAKKAENRRRKMEQKAAQEAKEKIETEFRAVKKTLKQGSKNELINLVLNLMMELADHKNALKQVFEENKALKEGSNVE